MFLFIALETFSLYLISQNKTYQRSVLLSSSNIVVAKMYDLSSNVVEFFKLRKANANLSEENTNLQNQIIELKNQFATLQPTTSDNLNFDFRVSPEMEYRFISAKVIGNSTNKLQNYITINKGLLDGVKPDMGVVSDEGIVGIVQTVSDRFATIISVLNPKLHLSSKFLRNNYTGSLQWSGDDYRFSNLMDIARHVDVKLGDTIVTSGLTLTFPEGIPVGIVDNYELNESDPYYTIFVKLAVNFRTLSYVKIIDFKYAEEEKQLREKIVN